MRWTRSHALCLPLSTALKIPDVTALSSGHAGAASRRPDHLLVRTAHFAPGPAPATTCPSGHPHPCSRILPRPTGFPDPAPWKIGRSPAAGAGGRSHACAGPHATGESAFICGGLIVCARASGSVRVWRRRWRAVEPAGSGTGRGDARWVCGVFHRCGAEHVQTGVACPKRQTFPAAGRGILRAAMSPHDPEAAPW